MERWVGCVCVGLLASVWASPAGAINITSAAVVAGTATVSGDHAERLASITWEGVPVAESNRGGAFTFTTGDVPSDCVGSLSDGVATVEVALAGCAPPAGGVLKTGQTQCWDGAGVEIDCAGTGQDGEIQAGVPRSYTANEDGTITDNVTGLMWETLGSFDFAANPGDPHDVDNTYTWDEAFQKIAALNGAAFAGHSDWRLPNLKELQSLVFPGRGAPAADPIFHDGAGSFTRPTGCYWSSTSPPSTPFQAFCVSFTQGTMLAGTKTSPANQFARAVRGPVALAAPASSVAPAVRPTRPINVTRAEVVAGMATVAGDQAARSALVTWEGIVVARTTNGGAFVFTTADIPSDCVGTLGDGVNTVEVPLDPCTPPPPPSARVPKTGQTRCWDSAGTEIACAGTGQDGELQVGVPRSYTDNGDTITDDVTGLTWEKLGNLDFTPNPDDLHDVDNNTRTWEQAFEKIAALNAARFAGHDDWRLPNILELASLADFARETSRPPGALIPAVDPAFDNGIDSFTLSSGYWASTTSPVVTFFGYGVNFVFGNVYATFKTTPFENGSVRAVRGP